MSDERLGPILEGKGDSDYERYLNDGYNGRTAPERAPAGPSGEDFWGGGLVGVAEPDPSLNDGQTEIGVADGLGGPDGSDD